MKKISLSVIIILLAFTSKSQYVVEQVANINPTGWADPSRFVTYQGNLYFSAISNGDYGLWKTDGTTAGTEVVKNISPAVLMDGTEPIILNNKMLFQAYQPQTGSELWISDGTTVGTNILADKNPGSSGFLLSNFARKINSKIVFSANDGVNGHEPWISDGTASGTQMLKNINATGSSMSLSNSNYSEFNNSFSSSEVNGKVLFSANDGANGTELWITDGTSLGTFMLKDLNPSGNGNPRYFIEYQNKIYFSALGGLWVSDGTSIGTQLVKSGQFYYLTVFNNKMYMMGYFFDGVNRSEVFESDGTTAGTIQVSNINQTNYAEPQNFIVFNNTLFFKADDGTHGYEIWTIDVMGSVSFFGDLDLSSSYGLGEFYEFDNKLFFGGDQDINGVELWYTDGTYSGTHKIAPIISPNNNPLANTYEFYEYNDALYFAANYTSDGNELYKVYNPTSSLDEKPEGQLVLTMYPNPTHSNISYSYEGENELVTLRVIDLFGKELVLVKNPSKAMEVDLTSFSAGNFLIEFETAHGQKIVKRVVKE